MYIYLENISSTFYQDIYIHRSQQRCLVPLNHEWVSVKDYEKIQKEFKCCKLRHTAIYAATSIRYWDVNYTCTL